MGPVDLKRHYENMLLNFETSGKTYFRYGKLRPIVRTEYKAKPTCLRARPPPLKDTHALTDWYEPKVPFNLMHRPKEIVGTNPWDLQKPFKEPEDKMRDEVQKTRPRVVMTPAVSTDDIDPDTRKMLLDDIYSTEVRRMMRNSGATVKSGVRAPLPDRPAQPDPIKLPKLSPPYVSPEWRKETAAWEKRQLRIYCERTKNFWLAYKPQHKANDETTVDRH